MSRSAIPPVLRPDGQVVSIGECMVEMTRGPDRRFALAYGGDTFNTAVYLARAGVDIAYATALGDDPYSAGILELAQAEGIDRRLMATLPGRMPGLYVIETTAAGERTFWYWRDRAAARDLFVCGATAATVAEISAARLVYISGITLSLYGAAGLDRLADALQAARANGAVIAMDSNYRPRGWGGDLDLARATFARFWRSAHIALPTFDDEQALWGDPAPAATIDRLASLGVAEVVVKNGAAGALVHSCGATVLVPCPQAVTPVDTTAAGDSFNAGYLARRLAGDQPTAASAFAHRLAAIVIQHRGAIVPQAATAAVFGA
jgi:2-dehydro-3-deoxygluconokinase